jgi:hypothetical protein
MEGEWEFAGIGNSKINIRSVIQWINYKKYTASILDISSIAYKPIDSIQHDDTRFKISNLKYPLIVVAGMPNPHNKDYRLIDGRHRLLHLILSCRLNANCYILTLEDVLPFVEKI